MTDPPFTPPGCTGHWEPLTRQFIHGLDECPFHHRATLTLHYISIGGAHRTAKSTLDVANGVRAFMAGG